MARAMATAPRGLKKAKLGPGEFEITCPNCQKVHHRGGWSIAHIHVAQIRTCDGCNKQCAVPRR